MTTTTHYIPPAAPPLGRNWTDADVCAFHGFASIELLMKMPGFPAPIPYPLKGRRWRPEDHLAFREGLTAASARKAAAALVDAMPELDLAEWRARKRQARANPSGGSAA